MLIRLYSRPGCHLCDVARQVIEEEVAGTSVAFEEVDIEGDDSLELGYGVRIPVVEIDGQERFEIQVDPADLAAIVRQAAADPGTL